MSTYNNIFNEMTYDYGWRKSINLKFGDEIKNVELNFVAYKKEDNITNIQKESYSWIIENFNLIVEASTSIILKYIETNYSSLNITLKNLFDEANPIEIIFERDEPIIGFIFDCNFDEENGIGIKIKDKKIIDIGPQDIVL
ncbi:MAG: DUF6985 domain-containing protein [Cetobacterium sp.]|uniref:DUF6985 domain-containing protein n=1 Tax=Cetobacterium sp. TaxID=2071632 RepID=UPI003EE66991